MSLTDRIITKLQEKTMSDLSLTTIKPSHPKSQYISSEGEKKNGPYYMKVIRKREAMEGEGEVAIQVGGITNLDNLKLRKESLNSNLNEIIKQENNYILKMRDKAKQLLHKRGDYYDLTIPVQIRLFYYDESEQNEVSQSFYDEDI